MLILSKSSDEIKIILIRSFVFQLTDEFLFGAINVKQHWCRAITLQFQCCHQQIIGVFILFIAA